MRPNRFPPCPAILSALLMVHWLSASAAANGYWNVPSTFCQCMGFGWGAGYHAPLVLGPINCDEWCHHKEVRLPYAPASCCAYHGSFGCDCAHASRLEHPIVPAEPSVAVPAPAAAIFAPPIEP